MIELTSDIKKFIAEHENEDIRELALKASRYPQINMQDAIQQIAGRRIAKSKIPSWYAQNDIIYPPHISMEQCSSEQTASYKASLSTGNTIIDLTGGFGVDLSFMAQNKTEAYYIETQPHLVELAQHNFKVLGLDHITAINNNGINFLRSEDKLWDTIYIDPARRNTSGRKTVLIEDCTPNLIEIDSLLNQKSKQVIIKLSPMLDITHALNSISNITDIHIISVNNECKELLLVKSSTQKEVKLHCINMINNGIQCFSFTKDNENNAAVTYSGQPEKYLYEPNSSILKAGAYKYPADYFNLKKLHINSHLYTSDLYIPDFPGRHFTVKNVFGTNKKDIKQYLTMKQANISTRNYPLSVAEIRKQTKLKDGGNDYIFATTLVNEKKVLILCEKVE